MFRVVLSGKMNHEASYDAADRGIIIQEARHFHQFIVDPFVPKARGASSLVEEHDPKQQSLHCSHHSSSHLQLRDYARSRF